MRIDPLLLVGGSNIPICDGLSVRQPLLDDIRQPDVGEDKYRVYVNLFALTLQDLFGDGGDIPSALLEHLHVYDVLSGLPDHAAMLSDALRFFIGTPVVFDAKQHCFATSDGVLITREVFNDLSSAILQISCVSEDETPPKYFPNEKARKIWEKIAKGRKEAAKRKSSNNKDMTLANIVSKVSAKSQSYNLINIWGLTVWQLFDQFACLCLNNQMDVFGLRWAAWGKDDFDFSLWYKANNK